MIHFEWVWLLLLIPLPLLVHSLTPPAKQEIAALKVPFYPSLVESDFKQASKNHRWRMLLMSSIWLLLLVSAARPQIVGDYINVPISGRDLMMAVDVSGSMQEQDILHGNKLQTRLDAVKRVGGQFIERRVGDRIGLILFGTQAYLQVPLSLDRNTVIELLNESLIGIAGEKTAIGDAIGLSIKRLQSLESDQKVLILLTDGSNTAGTIEPSKAADLARIAKLRIHTVGIGATEMEVDSFFGRQTVNPSRDLDETLLRHIATTTGGQYFRATDEASLGNIYALIDQLEPIEKEAQNLRPTRSLFFWPLGLALVISGFWMLMHCVPIFLSERKITHGEKT
ncbi:MAG: VWA domain-containing protein [Gammaproteobacteria bacterium]|nr:VWA domain-containing protein [Gammaproteobacteria bacterium]